MSDPYTSFKCTQCKKPVVVLHKGQMACKDSDRVEDIYLCLCIHCKYHFDFFAEAGKPPNQYVAYGTNGVDYNEMIRLINRHTGVLKL
jgi:hypothetical protein